MKLIPTTTQPVTITLYQGIPFDNNYSEHTLLSTQFKYRSLESGNLYNVGNDKENFINMKINNVYVYPRTTKSGTFNFAFGNGLVTSVVMELTDNEINSNYMKVTSGEDNYYYFITGITQKNETTYLLNLELDVVMTYSDEFLTSLNEKPIMVERKHCRRYMKRVRAGQTRKWINDVCFNQESTFSKFKSNIINGVTPMQFTEFEFEDYLDSSLTRDWNDRMGNVLWAYIILSSNSNVPHLKSSAYYENGMCYPYIVCCVPIIKKGHFVIRGTYQGSIKTWSFTKLNAIHALQFFSTRSDTQKIVISPYPPFNIVNGLKAYYPGVDDGKTIELIGTLHSYEINSNDEQVGELASGTLTFPVMDNKESGTFMALIDNTLNDSGYIFIQLESCWTGLFRLDGEVDIFSADAPTITQSRDSGEIKLSIAPFRDIRMGSYYGGEYHINTQYLFLNQNTEYDIKPCVIASPNPECNSYFNYVDLKDFSLTGKMGNTNSVAYNLPVGTNALTLFNQTQSNQYENSKIVNAISNGLKIVGGTLAMMYGGTMAKAGGAISIGSGLTGEINTFTDWNAKIEDLTNTQNSYNFAGSSFSYDYASAISDVDVNSMIPYLIYYGVSPIELEMAGEFLYHYGYDYNCESYFDTRIYDYSDNIFERTIFNYVKIRDDITTRLIAGNNGIPLVVAKKFNDILNAGIKFWTFFNMDLTNSDIAYNVLNNYFHHSIRCNAELII